MLLSLARASQLAPFGSRLASDDVGAVRLDRRFWGQVLGLGLLLALVGTLVPFVLAIVVGMALALTVGSILVFRAAGVPRMVAAAIGASVVGVVLHVPWSLDLIRPAAGWESFAGIRTTTAGSLSLGELLRFETGPYGAPPLGWGFLLAAGLALVIGRSWRLEWAARAWMVALAGWGALWASEAGWLPVGLPAPEVVLAPVAAALALSAAMGMAAFEIDLRAYRFGWRQVLALLAGVSIVAAALPLLGGLIDGRWSVPESDFNRSLDQLFDQGPPGSFRVLWLGDPEVLPVASWSIDDRLAYATSNEGTPTVVNLWSGTDDGATANLRRSARRGARRRHDPPRATARPDGRALRRGAVAARARPRPGCRGAPATPADPNAGRAAGPGGGPAHQRYDRLPQRRLGRRTRRPARDRRRP